MDRVSAVYLQLQGLGGPLFPEVQEQILISGRGRCPMRSEVQPVHKHRHIFPQRSAVPDTPQWFIPLEVGIPAILQETRWQTDYQKKHGRQSVMITKELFSF